MARIRTLKPEFFQNEEIAKCSPHARLLAIGLLQMADVRGRIRYVPMQVHAQVFPWEALVKVPVLLGELQEINYVKKYRVDGREYLWVVQFEKHQRITGKEAQTDSQLPEFVEECLGETSGCFSGKYLDAQEREREREREEEDNTDSLELPSKPPNVDEKGYKIFLVDGQELHGGRVVDFEITGEKAANGHAPSWILDRRTLDNYQRCYSGIDVEAEVHKAASWITSNPTKRKTRRGMPKFLNNWLARAVDR